MHRSSSSRARRWADSSDATGLALVVCFVVSVAALGSCRCSEHDEDGTLRGPPLTPTAQAWVTSVRTNLPIQMCDHPFFRDCFDIDVEACRREAVRLFDACANEHRAEIPDVPTPVSGKQAGRTIGRCVGRRLELTLRERHLFRDSAQCQQPENMIE